MLLIIDAMCSCFYQKNNYIFSYIHYFELIELQFLGRGDFHTFELNLCNILQGKTAYTSFYQRLFFY